jgi:hypothetical protein
MALHKVTLTSFFHQAPTHIIVNPYMLTEGVIKVAANRGGQCRDSKTKVVGFIMTI